MPISIIPSQGATGTEWGQIKGTLANQADLNSALDGKASASHATDTGNPHQTSANQVLPAQSGNGGKALVTDGSNAEWSNELPVQAANTEQLSANKTLTASSPRFHFIEPVSTNRSVYLPPPESCNGRVFTIQNAASPSLALSILVFVGSTQIATICPRNTVDIVSNGSAWKQYFNESISLGSNSVAYQYSVSIGAGITSNSNYSIALGYCSSGNNSYGVSLGAYSTTNNMNFATTLGAYTNCYRQGEICKSFDSLSNSKWSIINWTAATTNDSWTEALVGTGRCTVLVNTIFSFRMILHGRDATRNIARSWELLGSVRRNSTSFEFVGGTYVLRPIASDSGTEAWDARLSIDTTYNAIRVEVRGDSSGTIGWNASSVSIETKRT